MGRVDRLGEAARPANSIREAAGAGSPPANPAPAAGPPLAGPVAAAAKPRCRKKAFLTLPLARGVTLRAETGPGLEPAGGSGAAAPVLARGGGAPRADE